jgi:hypothetical protein
MNKASHAFDEAQEAGGSVDQLQPIELPQLRHL